MLKNAKVIVIDDDKSILKLISRHFEVYGITAQYFDTELAALEEIKSNPPDILILDIHLPNISGIEILKMTRKEFPTIQVIMITGYTDIKEAVEIMKLGAFDYLAKPFFQAELYDKIKKAFEDRITHEDYKGIQIIKELPLKDHHENILVGESPEIQKVKKEVELVAPTDMAVIIEGESGTGKELIAKMIYKNSKRYNKPLIAVDCAAIPETLMESEFFGYTKGSFTGANANKSGKLLNAHHGTLYLDELSNLSYSIQLKLLRVFEEKKICPIGGDKNIDIDVRIIIATSNNLENLVQQGKFRLDLYHRLNQFRIVIPPLSQREGDLAILNEFYLNKANREFNKNVLGFDDKAWAYISNYNWPGNVRELKNEIRRGVLLTDSKYIMSSHLSHYITEYCKTSVEKDLHDKSAFANIMNEVEENLIKQSIIMANGNKTLAAKTLNISRKALYRKMDKLGI